MKFSWHFLFRGFARTCALGVAFSLGGCILDWEKPQLDIAPASAYRNGGGRGESNPISENWAAGFGSSELTRLTVETLAANLDIGAAAARIAQADAQARISSAPLFPQLNFNASTARGKTPGTTMATSGPFYENRRWNHALGLNAAYQFDFWGRYGAQADAARFTALASRYDRAVIAISSVASLANAYFALLGAQERLKILADNVKIAEGVLRAVQLRVEVGAATNFDVAQQESTLAITRANKPLYEQTVAQNRALIAVLAGRTPESLEVRGGSLLAVKIPAVRPGAPSQLLRRRPDIAEAEAKLESAHLSVESARAAFFPNISLTGELGLQSILLKNFFRPEAVAYSVAAQLVQPVFDGHNLQGQLELQKAKAIEDVMLYRKQVLTAFSDVEIALANVRNAAERENLLAAAVSASRRAYEASMTRLSEGTIDIVTLSTVQGNLFTTQDQLAQARQARLQALVGLYQALGGGWTDIKRELARLDEIVQYNDVESPIP